MGMFKQRNNRVSGKCDYKNEWFTPPEVVESIGGGFDLDPCSSPGHPFEIARKYYFVNGLSYPWDGRVWLNPPYSDIDSWMSKMAGYGNGVALVFARTETKWFTKCIWDKADAVYFIGKRLVFYDINGKLPKHNAGAPSVLVAYGRENVQALWGCKLPGRFVLLRNN